MFVCVYSFSFVFVSVLIVCAVNCFNCFLCVFICFLCSPLFSCMFFVCSLVVCVLFLCVLFLCVFAFLLLLCFFSGARKVGGAAGATAAGGQKRFQACQGAGTTFPTHTPRAHTHTHTSYRVFPVCEGAPNSDIFCCFFMIWNV